MRLHRKGFSMLTVCTVSPLLEVSKFVPKAPFPQSSKHCFHKTKKITTLNNKFKENYCQTNPNP